MPTERRAIDDPVCLARAASIVRAALDRQGQTPTPHPVALYRHFDENDVLLYVGISSSPDRRAQQHRKYSEWAHLAVRRADEWFDDWADALRAEGTAIRTEAPVFNRTGPGNPETRDARIREYLMSHAEQLP